MKGKKKGIRTGRKKSYGLKKKMQKLRTLRERKKGQETPAEKKNFKFD